MENKSRHEEVLVALRKIVRSIELRSRQLVRSHGLTGPQMLILKTLLNGGESTISQLAGQMSLSQATVTNILNRLETRGLISRSRSETDRRCVYIRLTRQARYSLLATIDLTEDRFANRFTALKEWQQLQLISSLNRVSELMDTSDIDTSYQPRRSQNSNAKQKQNSLKQTIAENHKQGG